MLTVDHPFVAIGDSSRPDRRDTAQHGRLRRRVRETAPVHRMMRELLTLVPPDGAPWPTEARARWMAAFAAVADVIYEDGHRADLQGDEAVDRPMDALDVAAVETGRSVDLRGERVTTGGPGASGSRPARHRRALE